jgi:threonine/homoserine/homoserine lactone efflux protein
LQGTRLDSIRSIHYLKVSNKSGYLPSLKDNSGGLKTLYSAQFSQPRESRCFDIGIVRRQWTRRVLRGEWKVVQHGRPGPNYVIPERSSLILFLGAALVLLAIPGPAVFYIVGRSIGLGRNAGVVSALGIAVGTCAHVAAAIAFGIAKYIGAAYLIYLGVQKIRREESLEFSASAPRTKLSRIFGQGIIVNLLNPKTALFFFAFLPQFVNPSCGPVAAQILFLGLLLIAMGVVNDTLWALFAGAVADRLRGNPSWSRRQRFISGGMLISLGVATAVSGHGPRK